MNDQPHLQQQNSRAGFSLIEMIVTLGVIGIIAAVSAPAFMSMAPNMALKSATRDLYSNLQKAKITAIKENKNVIIRFPPVGGGYYYFDNDASGGYNAGDEMVVLDEDLNGNGTLDAGEDANGNATLDTGYGYEIKVGTGPATKDWNDTTIDPATATTHLQSVTFNTRGLATLAPVPPPPVPPAPPSLPAVYLQNSKADTCYSVEVRTAGSLKIRRFYGSSWTD